MGKDKKVKDFRLCPSCQHRIERKNFRGVTARCLSCKKVTCEFCRVKEVCLDCYIKNPDSNPFYFRVIKWKKQLYSC